MKLIRVLVLATAAVASFSVAGCASKAPPPAVVKG